MAAAHRSARPSSGPRRLLAAAAGALLLGTAPAAEAIGSVATDDGEVSLDAIGNVRLTGAYLHFRDMPAPFAAEDDGLLGAVARLVLSGGLGPELSYDANLFTDLSRAPAQDVAGTFASSGSLGSQTPYRSHLLTWSFWERGTVTGRLGVDRLSVSVDAEPVLLTAGRFPVNYSVTNLFTPNDFFAPFSATAINTVYKPGVDAVRLLVALGELSGLELVQVVGYDAEGEPRWAESAALARASTVLWDFEWAALGGKLAERWVTGGSLQGELGPIGLRAEGHAGFADANADGALDDGGLGRDEVYARLSAGLEIPFEWQNALVGAEYAFVSDGAAAADGYGARALRLMPDDFPYLGRHYVGAMVRGEIIPILQASVLGIVNAQDPSGLVAVSLLYSVADEAEFVGGILVPWGAAPTATAVPPGASLASELGLLPVTAFAETRFYF